MGGADPRKRLDPLLPSTAPAKALGLASTDHPGRNTAAVAALCEVGARVTPEARHGAGDAERL